MKLTLKTDYALRVLIYLQEHRKATIKDIANFYNIKKNHLSVVVSKLSELGYIDSITGPGGGISIRQKALNISVGEIVRNFEDTELVECFNSYSNMCRLSSTCKLKLILTKANKQFFKELDKFLLSDIRLDFKKVK